MPAFKVSVLVTTYNRSLLLRRALASVLRQDYEHMQVVVIDDCSTDDTEHAVISFRDERVRYIKNKKNVGGTQGDLAIIKRFLDEFCNGDAFIYLCDDDYWRSKDMISRQVAAMQEHPNVAFVQGGMVHCYPHRVSFLGKDVFEKSGKLVMKLAPNEPYVTYSHVGDDNKTAFWGTLFPKPVMTGLEYLRLFGEDPKNRNIVIGATLFDTKKFKASGVIDRAIGVKWQAGYAILAGAATQGDVVYMDEPCVMNAVTIDNASHRGTQLAHMRDCLGSIDAAFGDTSDPEFIKIRGIMARSVFTTFMCNKISWKWGWMKTNTIGDLDHIMVPPISAEQFRSLAGEYGVPMSDDNLRIIDVSDLPLVEMLSAVGAGVDVPGWHRVKAMAS